MGLFVTCLTPGGAGKGDSARGLNVSSTEVRERLSAGASIDGLIGHAKAAQEIARLWKEKPANNAAASNAAAAGKAKKKEK